MQRTKRPEQKQPTAILTSDWHLRETTPVCRTDDFWEAQWKKVSFVAFLQQKYGCPVWHAGDLFHHWKPSPYLISKAIHYLPNNFYTIYGQHDLPQHSLDLLHKSGTFTLFSAGKITVLGGTHFGQEVTVESLMSNNRKVLLWHRLVWTRKAPWPGCTEPRAEEVLDRYHDYDLIVTGDNHQSFVVEGEAENLLVNPGSLMRQTADQADHRPTVYLWFAETNTVKAVPLPIEQGVVTREHIEHSQKRDERIEAFISRLSDEWAVGVSFEDNLERFFKENKTRDSVKEIVRRSIEP